MERSMLIMPIHITMLPALRKYTLTIKLGMPPIQH